MVFGPKRLHYIGLLGHFELKGLGKEPLNPSVCSLPQGLPLVASPGPLDSSPEIPPKESIGSIGSILLGAKYCLYSPFWDVMGLLFWACWRSISVKFQSWANFVVMLASLIPTLGAAR